MLRTLATYFSQRLSQHDLSAATFLHWIPHISLPMRKVLLTICQTGLSPGESPDIRLALNTTYDLYTPRNNAGDFLSVEQLDSHVTNITTSHVLRSFFSMAVRCDIFIGSEEHVRSALIGGIEKEFKASQEVFADHQLLDYSSLFGNLSYDWSPFRPITPAWTSTARWFANHFAQRMGQMNQIIYPTVQRRKNMSQSSCSLLWEEGYRFDTRGRYELRTIDLELYYFETGIMIGGECEIRWAWRFNDLKPRAYYCIGGKVHWVSRYMKRIALIMMDAFPITHRLRRRFPDDLSRFLEEDDTIILWDYESFTSSLSELRFYLYWVSRYLEDDPLCHQNPLRLFDLREGVVETFIWDLLDRYNEDVNITCEFSLHRLVDTLGLAESDEYIHTMMNSGPLGVPGNIGFSTSLHGLHTGAMIKGKDKGVCVGDDAFGLEKAEDVESAMQHISHLGRIHPDKYSLLRPVEPGETTVGKFLKRRMERSQDSFWLDHLFDFPIFAITFGLKDRYHTIFDNTPETIACKLITQTGALLWDLMTHGQFCSDWEWELMRDVLIISFKAIHLGIHGSLPYTFKSDIFSGGYCPLAIPSLTDVDPRREDWAEELWHKATDDYILLPLSVEDRKPIETFKEVGQSFNSTHNQFLGFMQDLGVLDRKADRMVLEVNEKNYRTFRKMVSGKCHTLYTYTFVKEPPLYFNDLLDDVAPHEILSSPFGKYSTFDYGNMSLGNFETRNL